MRRLEESGFDFSKLTLIDFNVEFGTWPPSQTAVHTLAREYPNLKLYEPQGDFCGDITFRVYDRVSFELVMQKGVSAEGEGSSIRFRADLTVLEYSWCGVHPEGTPDVRCGSSAGAA